MITRITREANRNSICKSLNIISIIIMLIIIIIMIIIITNKADYHDYHHHHHHDQSSFHQEVKECPGKTNIPAPTYKTYQALQVFPGHLVSAMIPMINCKSSEGAQSV